MTSICVEVKKKLGNFTLDTEFSSHEKVIGLYGASGSGKTSILNMVSGFLIPDSGRIMLDGEVLFSSKEKINRKAFDRKIGYIFQTPNLFPHLTVMQNLRFGYRGEDESLYEKVVEVLELAGIINSYPSRISGGEKQRVAIGRAILTEPKILLLDEPLTGLQTELKTRVLFYIREIIEKFDIPVIYVSHSIEEILALTDQIVFISKGSLVGSGNIYKLLRNSDFWDFAFNRRGFTNVLPARVVSCNHDDGFATVEVHGRTQQLRIPCFRKPPGKRLLLDLPARNIMVYAHKGKEDGISNWIKNTIDEVITTDGYIVLRTSGDFDLIIEMSAKSFSGLGLEKNDEVHLFVREEFVRFF